MKLVEYPTRAALMAGLAATIADELRRALVHGPATLSVPGGTTPGPVFDALCQEDLDWARVAVVLNDERWVDESSPRSNTRLLRERLITGRAAKAHVIPLYLPGTDNPDDALQALEEGLLPHLPLTTCLLGMGADMHTASLFPGADRLVEGLAPGAPHILPMRADAAGEPRLTLTAPVLTGANHLHILITGVEKKAALSRALGLSPLEAPVAAVLPFATVHWAE
jgi:6-phosphogluconolactonase